MMEWYEQSFGEDYLIVYKHRDMQGAREEVGEMIGWLDLEPGASVFDLCCGMGRHSLALADLGFRVTGMDLSKVLLREARERDPDDRVEWLQGDMREVPLTRSFDAVVNWFTSFGYFNKDEENAKVLGQISRLLSPTGRFLIDYLNADYVARNLVPHSVREEAGMTIDEKRSIEDGCVRKRITISEPGSENRSYLEQVKLYKLADFHSMCQKAGLIIEKVYGNYDGLGYDETESPRLIMLGRKAGDAGGVC
ncbi:class I SAM-dependent methyltransferase [Paenibacillus sp. J2TS4]|uniref:class I SAM-dependent methyltransferase n=1 Tax=Paenibacillus sp. J2TS4 TaxID=2807194 RepID=UPI001B11714C|nr:class I SAM-dependent methyltransferase [Paenibacillus sp. J2TS4]GIP31309.1 methyltransferase [Paenibacillus sp. J2TS4]